MSEQGNAAWAEQPTLRGEHVALAPLSHAHADGLRTALAGGELAKAWYTNVPTPEGVDAHIDSALAMQAKGVAWAFA
ncbi:MAG: GNAT family N-acetyltransferase, partial [Lysobacter sp.]